MTELLSPIRVQDIEYLNPKTSDSWGGWSRRCRFEGVEYHVSVKRGKSVRIPFKPRGKNRGWKWNGCVYADGKQIWVGPVPGSIGVLGLLNEAGV
jgi:hypothetical protein